MTQTRRGPLGLLRQPDFAKLWSAETISQFGTQVSGLAIPLIAAVTLGVSPFEFGLLATIQFLPFILISLPAGVWVDRLRRRPILIVGDLGRGLALLTIPVAYIFNVLTVWQLYVVAFAVGCLTVFFDVAYQAYLPSLVERDEILEGNSKLEISRSTAQVVGPGLAGVLIGIVTAPIAVILDSLSYMGSAAFVFGIRKQESDPQPPRAADGSRPGMRQEVAAGLRYVLTNKYLRAIAACTASSNLFSNMGFTVLVLYLVRTLGFTPELIGITFSAGSVGALVAAFTGNRIGKLIGVGPAIIVSALIFGPAFLLVPLAPRDLALPLIALAIFLGTFGGVVYNINQVSFRQAITPERMQGRMNATMRFIVWGTIPPGNLIGGFLGGAIGLHETLLLSAILSVTPFLFVLFSPVRSIQEMPGPVEEVPDAETVGEAVDDTARPVPVESRPPTEEELR